MERWRSSWRTLYPSSEENLELIKKELESSITTWSMFRDALEERGMLDKTREMLLEDAILTLQNLLNEIEKRPPEEALEFALNVINFESKSRNPYIKTAIGALKQILEGKIKVD